MHIVDLGSGAPIVVVPGVQGRWEWMRPGIEALARRCRVITFSLADEPSCAGDFDPAQGLGCYVDQVRAAMDARGVDRAAIGGVSYGGLVAAAFAARHPQRTASLVLVSALPPTWRPDARVRFYLRAPRALSPLFLLGSLRMYQEIAVAAGGALTAVPVAARHGCNVLRHMLSPARMARRVQLLEGLRLTADIAGVTAPVLIVTGDPSLDRVVPVRLTREYLRLLPHARSAVIERTGHLGIITRPDEFARLVAPFVDETLQREARRRVG